MKKTTSLRDEAYDRLEEMIVTQVLPPGSRVTEQELAVKLAIGRTPVREALQRLAHEKLIEVKPRAAIVVLEMTLERQRHLLEFRSVVERQVVQLATVRASDAQRSRMLQLQRAVEDAAEIGEGGLYLRVVREIQELLCEAADNEFLSDSMAGIYALARQFTYMYYKQAGSLKRAAAAHSAVLKAVASKDPAAALEASHGIEAYLAQFMKDMARITTVKKKKSRAPAKR